MNAPGHRLVLASAGTGKTYRLSGHFLRLLLAGVEPERILATTFTRKAAGEILDRVLERLLAAALDDAHRDRLAEELAIPLSQEACLRRLVELARRIDRFRVRTLDAFFVQVAGLFDLDLGLPPGWGIVDELDDELLRSAAAGRVLAEARVDERVALLRALARGAATRSIFQTLFQAIDGGRALFLESAPEAWRGPAPPEALEERVFAEHAAWLEAFELPLTTKGTPHGRWDKNFKELLDALARQDGAAFLAVGLVSKVLAGEERFARVEIPPELSERLKALARHFAALEIEQIARRTRAARDLLERFEKAYQAEKHRAGAYRFEDLPARIGAAPAGGGQLSGRLLELWFRLDGRIDHLLLDEFQDTAPAQWRALAPLAEEVLADGTGERTFFCVGDVKQSIYGWRSADPRLLEGLEQRYGGLECERLDQSWRSSQVVLDAVNAIFAEPSELAVFQHSDGEQPWRRAVAERFQARFREHSAAKELTGAVCVWRPDGDAKRPLDATVPFAAERVRVLHEQAPEATIGVLVRSGKVIPRMMLALSRLGVHASGEGGNPLVDAESVQVFLSALQHADHPGDTAAAFHVECSPLAGPLGYGDPAVRAQAAGALRARLVHEGYGAVAASLLPAVENSDAFGAWDVGRFRQLIDLALAWEERADLSPARFVRLVQQTPVEDPNSTTVRVMTIHKSKGLEFDAVVLPELAAQLVREGDTFWSVRPDPFGPIQRVVSTARKELLPLSPELREVRNHALARALEESMCVLYVALTRAARRLELVLPPAPKEESSAKSFSNWILSALERELPEGRVEAHPPLVWRHPQNDEDRWHVSPQAARRKAVALQAPPPPADLGLAETRAPRALAPRTPSGEEGGAPTAADLLRPRRSASLGTLVHRLLEPLVWLDDFDRSPERLDALARAHEPDPERRRAALDLLERALDTPEIAALLTRPPDAGDLEVRAEFPFALPLADDERGGAFWTGAIDRLVLRRAGGRVVAAEVIDYKTDALPAGGDPTPLIDRYRPQLEAYRRAVGVRFDLEPGAITCRLALLAAGRVVTLGA